MPSEVAQSPLRTAGLLIARLIFAAVFLMAVTFKVMDMAGTAGYIAAAGFPFPLLLAWLAAIFEIALVLAFLTGAFFSEAVGLFEIDSTGFKQSLDASWVDGEDFAFGESLA